MISFDQVTTCRHGRVVLQDVSCRIQSGEFVLLLGANGAGKTTLLHHLNGIVTPDAGTVTVDGHDAADGGAAVREAVGVVFQEPADQLVGATVGDDVAFGPENLGLPRASIQDRVDESLAAVGLSDDADRSIGTLSHGEQTRVAIAGALAMQPAYLALDEPLVGIDARGRSRIIDQLLARNDGGTGVILATHDVRDVYEHADHVLGLDDGSLALDASPPAAAAELPSLGVRPPGG